MCVHVCGTQDPSAGSLGRHYQTSTMAEGFAFVFALLCVSVWCSVSLFI